MTDFLKNRWLHILTILLLIANIVTLTLLWTNNKKNGDAKIPPPPSGPAFEFLTKELSLNQQQQDAYKILREEHRAAQLVVQDSIRKSKDAFFELMKLPAVSDSLLQQGSSKAAAFQQQLDILTFKHFQKVRALCNAEQQIKFDNVIQDALRKMGSARPHGPGGPPPPGTREGDGPPHPPAGAPPGRE
jgi:periplasmic protein CpxP/Spy